MTDPRLKSALALARTRGHESLIYAYRAYIFARLAGDTAAAEEAVRRGALDWRAEAGVYGQAGPTFGSLFAGIGGFDLGFEHAGFRCAWQVEKDDACRSLLARHRPDVSRFADVCECGAHNLPAVDVICGGFPCQDLSLAGNRVGLAGARSGLFYEMMRVCYELRPRFLVWENVPGLYSSCSCRRCRRHCQDCFAVAGADEGTCLVCGSDQLRGRVLRNHRGADLFALISALGYIGYPGAWTLLDAQFFGLAQRRQRIFGVFARRDIGAARCAEILSLAARMPWNTEARPAARAGVAAGVTASAGHHGRSSPRGDGGDNLIAPTLGASFGRNRGLGNENEVDGLVPEPFTFDWQGGVGENDCAWLVDKPGLTRSLSASRTLAVVTADGVANAISSHHGRNSGEDTFVPVDITNIRSGDGVAGTLECGQDRHNRGQGVLAFTERTRAEGRTLEAQEGIAYALTNPGSGGRTHSRQIAGSFGVRRLTPRECERLQGFSDDWTAEGVDGPQSDSVRYRQLGNAVAVPCAEWIARKLKTELM